MYQLPCVHLYVLPCAHLNLLWHTRVCYCTHVYLIRCAHMCFICYCVYMCTLGSALEYTCTLVPATVCNCASTPLFYIVYSCVSAAVYTRVPVTVCIRIHSDPDTHICVFTKVYTVLHSRENAKNITSSAKVIYQPLTSTGE